MKNTLHIFGCSFSQLLTENTFNAYYNWRYPNIPLTWSEILSDKLKLNLNNTASSGASNDIILQEFSKNIEKIKRGDVVIFEWSFIERFSWETEYGVLHGKMYNSDTLLQKNCAESISINRTGDTFKLQIIDYMKMVDVLSNEIGFKLWYWFANQDMYKFINTNDKKYLLVDEIMKNNLPFYQRNTFSVVYERGGCDIRTETNGEVNDGHFGEEAHKIKAQLFFDHIKKYKTFV